MSKNFFKNNRFPPKSPLFDFYPSKTGEYYEIFLILGETEGQVFQEDRAGILVFEQPIDDHWEIYAIQEIFRALINDIQERTKSSPKINIQRTENAQVTEEQILIILDSVDIKD